MPTVTSRILGLSRVHNYDVPAFSRRVLPSGSYVRVGIGGPGQISGTVKVDSTPDIPVYRKVRLYRDNDGMVVDEVWSDPVTGEYVFADLALGYKYHVVAFDYAHDYRAVVADNLTPEVP
jgi:hypothetical protein